MRYFFLLLAAFSLSFSSDAKASGFFDYFKNVIAYAGIGQSSSATSVTQAQSTAYSSLKDAGASSSGPFF